MQRMQKELQKKVNKAKRLREEGKIEEAEKIEGQLQAEEDRVSDNQE